jgi:hypothetical protein
MLARLCCLAILALLGACAAAMPGYTPPPFKQTNKSSQPMKSGEMTPDGRYEMADEEKEMDCKRTAGAMSIVIERLKYRATEISSSKLAVAGAKAIAPLRKTSDKGFDRDAEYLRDRARLAAYNRHLTSKGCPTVDIEAELARPPEPIDKKY